MTGKIRIFSFLMVLWMISAAAVSAENEGVSEQKTRVNIIFNQSIDYELLRTYEATINYEYESIQAVTAEMNADYISAFAKEEQVKSIQYDQTVSIQSQVENWGISSLNVKKIKGSLTGKGVNIAVIDSGVNRSHPDLKISGGACFLALSSDTNACANDYEDDNGHGTHVAGIIAALDNDIGVVGVAPEANLFVLKVLDEKGEGSTSSIAAAIDWAVQHEMDLINLSLVAPEDDLILREIIRKAYNSNILIVAASGNKDFFIGTEYNVGYPARYDEVIAVSAVDSNLGILEISLVGPAVELAAPGNAIISTYPLSLGKKTGYYSMSGTSMAAPFVSAVAALYMEKYPDLSKAEIRSLLQENAIDLGEPGRDSIYGYGLVQMEETNSVISVSANGAKVNIQIEEIPLQAEKYNLYRYDTKIVSNGTSLSIDDYGVKGKIKYRLVPIVNDIEITEAEEVFTVSLTEPSIKDIDNKAWFSRNMLYLYHEGIMKGYLTGELKPQQLITREEAVMLLVNAIDLPIQSTSSFKDVNSSGVAAGHIAAAYKHNIITGFPDGTFRPKQAVTRAEMSILIANAYQLSENEDRSVSFSDLTTKMAGYEQIQKVVQNGIAQGFLDQTFRPYDYMNRATFAVFLSRAENELLK
ncbi:MAG: S8 family peptidase [Bacillus sp. (in: firmicutes)]